MKTDLELRQLEQYHGTEQYHNMMGVKITDGVKYIMEQGYGWLVTDFIVVAKLKPELRTQEFLTVTLKLENNKAEMIVTDGNEKTLYTQKYVLTDAKRNFTMYYEGDVLMLAGEY